MFKFFCNKCFCPKSVENPNKFYFSNCGHIYCEVCRPTKLCHRCKAPYAARIIDANMTKSMAVYFESPVNAFRRFQKIVEFQAMHDSLNAHYIVNIVPNRIQAALEKRGGMMRIDAHLVEKLAHETKRIEKLKAYLAYKKGRCHGRPTRGRSSKPSTYNRVISEDPCPRTPTISSASDVTLSSGDCTKSTDLSIQSDSFLHHDGIDFTM